METLIKTLLLYFSFFCVCSADPDIVFEKSPDVIQETLTRNMSMRCGLNQTVSFGGVKHVTSLVIMRDGGHVATVTQYDPATPVVDLDNLKVVGTVSESVLEQSYIELHWTYPSVSQQGTYVCELNGLNSLGHPVTFSKSLDVEVSSPTLRDLILHVHDLEIDNQGLKSRVSELQTDNEILKNEVSKLPSSQPVAFSAGINKAVGVSVGDTVIYNVVYTNDGNSYDPTTGLFVCKRKGLYRFDIHLTGSSGVRPHISLKHNNNYIVDAHGNGDGLESGSNNVLLHLSVGDVVKVVARYRSAYFYYHLTDHFNTFSGQLLA